LVVNGEADRMVSSSNSFDLGRRLPSAQLRLYPDAGHGGIFEYHEEFVKEALEFLEPSTSFPSILRPTGFGPVKPGLHEA
jgi:pimeloyl-ACP methyl ester carboxylesterase